MRFAKSSVKSVAVEDGAVLAQTASPNRVPGVTLATFSIIVTFVLVSLFVCIFVDRTMRDAKAAADSAAFTRATLVAKSYASYLSERASSVDLLARTVAFEFEKTNGTLDLNHLVNEGLIVPSEETLVTLVDAQGLVTKSWPTSAIRRVHLSDREHFVVQKNSPRDDLFISAPVLGRVSKKTTIQFTRKLTLPSEAFAGIVVVSQPPSFFTKTFANHANLGADGELLVFRSDGTRLVSATADGTVTSIGLPLSLYPESTRSHLLYRDPLDQHTRLYIRQPVPGLPLIAVIALSANDFYTDYKQRRVAYWGWAALLVFSMAVVAYLAIFATRRVLTERARMQGLAETDALTGLGNRRALDRYLRDAASDSRNQVALVLVDIRGFAALDAKHGADASDDLLAMVAVRLRGLALPGELVSRIRDQHFTIAFSGREVEARALAFVRSAIEAFGRPVQFHGNSEVVKFSFGVATSGSELAQTGELQAKAECALDLANQVATNTGGTEYRVYEQWMLDLQGANTEFEFDLDNAVRQREGIAPGYSPIASVSKNCITGSMVDPVWSRADNQRLSAEEFMPAAERLGLSQFIWLQTIEAAIRSIGEHAAQDLQITIRVPAKFITDADAIRLLTSGVVASTRIGLALTGVEDHASQSGVFAQARSLRSLGVSIYLVIDTSHCIPIHVLTKLAIDGIVIEGAMLDSLTTTDTAPAFIAALLSTADELGWKVMVGPVEQKAQWEWLTRHPGDIEAWGTCVGETSAVAPTIQ
ncbi:EAL domain-containing protein [Burkholderia ubonensis]|uniref:sensor domain-containing diguanylate cyclase n=1 Tax=Burkholderia ubonensis TaxID=101571 RepID=UPI0018DFBFA7|nr:diguanylate cyclase [Burkholderia ubonensis]